MAYLGSPFQSFEPRRRARIHVAWAFFTLLIVLLVTFLPSEDRKVGTRYEMPFRTFFLIILAVLSSMVFIGCVIKWSGLCGACAHPDEVEPLSTYDHLLLVVSGGPAAFYWINLIAPKPVWRAVDYVVLAVNLYLFVKAATECVRNETQSASMDHPSASGSEMV